MNVNILNSGYIGLIMHLFLVNLFNFLLKQFFSRSQEPDIELEIFQVSINGNLLKGMQNYTDRCDQ